MKFCVFHAMKAYTENGGIAPLILKLDIRWGEWSDSHVGRFTIPLPSGNEPWYSLNWKLGGPLEPVRTVWRREESCPCRETKPGLSNP